MRRGFTLIQIAVVLLIAGLMLPTILKPSRNNRDNRAYITNQKLDTIERALFNYQKAFGDLPCPADGTLADTAEYFAKSKETTDGTCESYHYAISGGGFTNPTGTYVGGVPARTLGLDDSYIYDGWGNRITYVIESAAASKSNWLSNYEDVLECDGTFSPNAGNGGWTVSAGVTISGGRVTMVGWNGAQLKCNLPAGSYVQEYDRYYFSFDVILGTNTNNQLICFTVGAGALCGSGATRGIFASHLATAGRRGHQIFSRATTTNADSFTIYNSHNPGAVTTTILDNIKVYLLRNGQNIQNGNNNLDVYDTSDTTAPVRDSYEAADLLNGAAMYALISHGANGGGAFPRNGGSTVNSTSGLSDYELDNADLNDDAQNDDSKIRFGTLNYNSGTSYFDDIVRYKDYDDILN